MKHNKILTIALTCALLLGAALFGGGTALASSGVMATPSTQAIYVDGQRVTMTVYSIGGNNYVRLRDIGKAVNFSVSYDATAGSVQIDSNAPYVEETTTSAVPSAPAASTVPAGAISVPQTDAAPFVPREGNTILCDDGTTYKITDMSHNREFPGALPTATCDWTQFPEVELPRAETRHFKNSRGVDYLFIRNLHEIRRMQYTAYNAIGANSQLWQNGTMALRENGTPMVQITLGIPDGCTYGSFWPWDASQITAQFRPLPPGNFPPSRYQIDAYDVYADGVFLYTEYMVS